MSPQGKATGAVIPLAAAFGEVMRMDNDDKPVGETEAEDQKTSRREALAKAGKAAYVAPGLILLAASRKGQPGSPPPPPG